MMRMGRPNKYETHVKPHLLKIQAWARDGLTMDQIAENLGIHVASLFRYQNEHPELYEALKVGKDEADIHVENALYRRALGYTYEEITYEDGVEVKRVVKEVQPDVTAQIFWLKNRRPQVWRDKQEREISGTLTQEIVHDLRKLDPAELAKLEEILQKAAETQHEDTDA